MKKQNGITLIALVISIIIMLILAGVSINAIVGENGIIGKAQDTLFLNSCAYLEEYFNQLYATCKMNGALEGVTPLETITNSGYSNYLFSTSEGYCLKKVVENEETGLSDTLILYLVKKEQLPSDIQMQLTGGDGLESRDYRKLRGCYGITSDLKAYYCENGLDTILGLSVNDLNADSPEIIAFDENSALASVVNGGTNFITNRDLKNVKSLTIDNTSELAALQNFSQLINLTTVNFKNLTIPNLSGIEGAVETLNYIKFTNCSVEDYSALNGLTNLAQLYLVTPTGKNEEIVRLGSIDKGIAGGKFSKLQYFGIVGNDVHLNGTNKNYSTARYGITDISALANFNDVTKKAIKYMNLQNLQLTNINCLVEFTNVYLIRLEENALTTLDGIQNMTGLKYLFAQNQFSNVTNSYTLGMNEGDIASSTDALSYVYGNPNTVLQYVDLRNNTKLKHVEGLSKCTGIKNLYMEGCTSIIDASTIATVLGNCGANYSLDGSYGLDIIADTTKVLSLSGKEMTISEFNQLKNKTNLTHLSLEGVKLKNDDGTILTNLTSPTVNETINEVLGTCVNLKYLQLKDITYLTDINFISTGKCTKIEELDLRNTSVTDLTNLNTYAMSLKSFAIDNSGIDITKIQSTINRCTGVTYWIKGPVFEYAGTCLFNWDLIKQLENCTDLKYLKIRCDIANITKGKTLNLSNTNLETIDFTYLRCVISYPTSVKTVLNDSCKVPVFVAGTDNLTKMQITYHTNVSSDAEWITGMKSLANATNLKSLIFRVAKNFKFQYLEYLKDLEHLESLECVVYSNNTSSGNHHTNLNGIGNLKNLKTLTLSYLINLEDISDLARCTKLENIRITNCKVNDISALAGLTALKTLNLSNNAINEVYVLNNLIKLESLDLSNNILNNFAYYTDANGVSRGYEVMDVFYDLNYKKKGALKKLYIAGNAFDDTEILLDLEWDAKTGF